MLYSFPKKKPPELIPRADKSYCYKWFTILTITSSAPKAIFFPSYILRNILPDIIFA
jgi:hypothetical protein